MEELIKILSECPSTSLSFDGSRFKCIMFGGSTLDPTDVMQQLESNRSTYAVEENLLPSMEHVQDVCLAVFSFKMSETARHRNTLIDAIIGQFYPV